MHYSNYHSNRSVILCNAPLGEEGGEGYEYAALEAAIKGEFLSSLFGDTDDPQSCRILCHLSVESSSIMITEPMDSMEYNHWTSKA